MQLIKNIYKFLKSIKFAVILILIIIVFSIFASLVPQDINEELVDEYFSKNYHPVLSFIILKTHFYNYYTSILFLIPAGLFFLNLLLCTLSRLRRQLFILVKKRFGPDLIHIGLLIILIGGLLSIFTNAEDYFYFKSGSTFELPGGYHIKVTAFDFLKYEDGSSKDWITRIKITKGENYIKKKNIRVNYPVKIGKYTLYQNDYEDNTVLYLYDDEGNIYKMSRGKGYNLGENGVVFDGVINSKIRDNIVVFEIKNHKINKKMILSVGDKIGNYTIERYKLDLKTRLKFVVDYGIYPVWIGIIIMTLGFCLTFIQKFWDRKNE